MFLNVGDDYVRDGDTSDAPVAGAQAQP